MKKPPKKILVIDDDPNIIKLINKWLKTAHCEVEGALNGQEGIQKAMDAFPDLILCDMMLPDINGVEVIRQLRAHPQTQDIPVLVMTVTMGVEVDKGDETIDIDGCLYRIFAKPLHVPKLLSEIRKSINRRIHGNPSDIEGS